MLGQPSTPAEGHLPAEPAFEVAGSAADESEFAEPARQVGKRRVLVVIQREKRAESRRCLIVQAQPCFRHAQAEAAMIVELGRAWTRRLAANFQCDNG